MSRYNGPPSRVDMYRDNMNRQGIGIYFVRESEFLRPFFIMVEKHIGDGGRLLECGYGPGTLGIYLSRCGYQVTSIDWDQDVIELARDTSGRLGGKVDYRLEDLFEVDKTFGQDSFDAVISDVTLEHFSDEDIVDALKKQLVVAAVNIFAVHCSNIRPDIIPYLDGGERLLKPSYWKGLIKEAGGEVIDSFGYGFSATRIGLWNWRARVIAENLFYKRLAPFAAATGFVVRRSPKLVN